MAKQNGGPNWPQGPPGFGDPVALKNDGLTGDNANAAIRRLLVESYGFEAKSSVAVEHAGGAPRRDTVRAIELAHWQLPFYPIDKKTTDADTPCWSLLRVQEKITPSMGGSKSDGVPTYRHAYALVNIEAAAKAERMYQKNDPRFIRTPAAPWFVPLTGNAQVIHTHNASYLNLFRPADRELLDQAQDAIPEGDRLANEVLVDRYLYFFCWAIRGDDGPFYVLCDLDRDVPLRYPHAESANVPDSVKAELKQKHDDLKEVHKRHEEHHVDEGWAETSRVKCDPQAEAGVSLFYLDIEQAKRVCEKAETDWPKKLEDENAASCFVFRLAMVSYAHGVFHALFYVEVARGAVALIDDDPLLAELDVVNERSDSLATFLLRQRLLHPTWREERPPRWLRGEPADERQQQCLADLEVELGKARAHARAEGLDRPTCVIRRCRFTDTVVLPRDEANWRFVDCQFLGGIDLTGQAFCGWLEFVFCDIRSPGSDKGSHSGIAFAAPGATLEQNLLFYVCAFSGRFFAPGLVAHKNVQIRGCRIARTPEAATHPVGLDQVDEAARRGYEEGEGFGNLVALNLNGARIEGDLEIAAALGEEGPTGNIEEAYWDEWWTRSCQFGNHLRQCLMYSLDDINRVIDEDIAQKIIGELDKVITSRSSYSVGALKDCLLEAGIDDDVASQLLLDVTSSIREFDKFHHNRSSQYSPWICSAIQGRLEAAHLQVGGDIKLHGLSVEWHMWLNGAEAHNITTHHTWLSAWKQSLFRAQDFSLNEAQVHGSASLSSTRVETELYLRSTSIRNGLILTGSDVGTMLYMNQAKVGGTLKAIHSERTAAMLHRRALRVGGDWDLSGADIQEVETGAIDVTGAIKARTGQFGKLTIGMGLSEAQGLKVKASGRPGIGSTCGRLEFVSIDVREGLDLSGLNVSLPVKTTHRQLMLDLERRALTVRNCKIGQNFRLYRDGIEAHLTRDWYGKTDVETLKDLKVSKTDKVGMRFHAWGGLDLRANRIGGDLVLSNAVAKGPIELSETEVGLSLRFAPYEKKTFGKQVLLDAQTVGESVERLHKRFSVWLEESKQPQAKQPADLPESKLIRKASKLLEKVRRLIDQAQSRDGIFAAGEYDTLTFPLEYACVLEVCTGLEETWKALPSADLPAEAKQRIDSIQSQAEPRLARLRKELEKNWNALIEEAGESKNDYKVGSVPLNAKCHSLRMDLLRCNSGMDLTGLQVGEDIEPPKRGLRRHDVGGADGETNLITAQGLKVGSEMRLTLPIDQRHRIEKVRKRSGIDNVAKAKSYDFPEWPKLSLAMSMDLVGLQVDRLAISATEFSSHIDLARAQVGRLEVLDARERPAHGFTIDMAHSRITRWIIDSASDPEQPGAGDYARILRRLEPFDRPSWLNVERSLRNEGEDEKANSVYYLMRRSVITQTWTRADNALTHLLTTLLLQIAALPRRAWNYVLRAGRWLRSLPGMEKVYRGIRALFPAIAFVWTVAVMCVIALQTVLKIPSLLMVWLANQWRGLLAFNVVMLVSGMLVYSDPNHVTASPELLEAITAVFDEEGGDPLPVKIGVVTPKQFAYLQSKPLHLIQGITPETLGLGFDAKVAHEQTSYLKEWDWTDGVALSLRYQVPIITLPTHQHWIPNNKPIVPNWQISVEDFALLQVVTGWVFWPIIIIGISRKIFRDRALAQDN